MTRKGRISYDEFERLYPNVKDQMRCAAKVDTWKPGDGWKVLIEYPFQVDLANGGCFVNESSEGCIMQALSTLLGKERLKQLYQKAYPDSTAQWIDGLDEWAPLIGGKVTKNQFNKLLNDLTDVYYHSLRGGIEEELDQV